MNMYRLQIIFFMFQKEERKFLSLSLETSNWKLEIHEIGNFQLEMRKTFCAGYKRKFF